MKKALSILIFITIFLGKNENISAQTESIKVEYKQESIDSSDYKLRRKYKYLDIIMKDEKNLFKIGVQNTMIFTENQIELMPHLIFEKKVSPAWSLVFDNEVGFNLTQDDGVRYNIKTYKYSLNIGTRYYYGIKKAIREKTSGNNFNHNYFEFNIAGFQYIEKSNGTLKSKYADNPNMSGSVYYHEMLSSIQISSGLQRRLSNYSFIDAKLTLGWGGSRLNLHSNEPYTEWYAGLNLLFGFGYSARSK